LGHIFARPDAGKTSLALNELVYFAHQLDEDRPALYLNNEEGIERIKARAMSAMLSVTPQHIMENYDWAEDKWNRGHGERLKFIGGINHISKVVQKLERFSPRVIVIDQGPKVDTYGNLEGVQRLQVLYNQYRDLANEHDCSIITLGQADNNAENRKYLNLNNLDSSKVAIQGELDWCLGIGRVNTEGFEEVRFLSNVKNKLTGRYGQGDVHFDIQCCRFND
jgi:RecA-family ATPase